MTDMNEVDLNGLDPADEDPEVHTYLAPLPAFAPSGPFAERVLSRVRRPPPGWYRESQLVARRWLRSGEPWFLLGAVALGSAIPTVALAALLATRPELLGGALRWAWTTGAPALRQALLSAVDAYGSPALDAARWIAPEGVSAPALIAGAAALVAGCAAALYFVAGREPASAGRR